MLFSIHLHSFLKQVRRTHYNKYAYLQKCLPRTYLNICVYLRKYLPRTYLSICVYLLKRVRRIHFIAVVIEEPQRGDTTTTQSQYSRCECRSYGAHFTFSCRYPGFHFGLCPHSTLGFARVSCLKALVISLNV